MRMIIREMHVDLSEVQDPNFTDVPKGFSGYKEIAKAKELEIIDGVGGGKFAPKASLTRAQMAKILSEAYDLEGQDDITFTDVKDSHWAKAYISALASNRITIGYPDGTFRPKKNITRQEFSAFLARHLNEAFVPHEYGNKLSNIINSGNFAKSGDWVYFGDAGIWKVSENERYVNRVASDQENNVAFLNVIGDWIYYSNAQDNLSIYKIKKDGSGRQKLVNAPAMYLHVVDDWMYYTNPEKEAIYKAKTDGSQLVKITETSSPFTSAVHQGWVYYVDSKSGGFYRIKTDGIQKMKLTSDMVTYYAVYEGEMYYVNEFDQNHLYKMNLDGSQQEKVLDKSMIGFNISDERVYYISRENGSLNMYSLDGTVHEELDANGYGGSVMIHGDWLYYSMYTEDGTYQWYKIRKNGDDRHQFPVTISFSEVEKATK
ncbi:DUF5050 domain-containing protein [Pontibacillus sp. HMF3514]|nr:DUF5050 domain-containing protein [Pontibacillus sp. HMF3514]